MTELVPPEMITLNVDDMLLSRMRNVLRETEQKHKKADPHIIYRVLPSIRAEDQESYNPKIISIGPFHHNTNELRETQQLKWQFLHNLIQRSHHNSLENYIKVVRKLESKARNCYSGKIEPDVDSFVEMLVLDGCFIIEFLLKWNLGSNDDPLFAVNWNIPLLRTDLLLLENQIPFFVLQSLFDASAVPELEVLLGKDCPALTLLAHTFFTRCENKGISSVPLGVVNHLLHLFHYTLRSPPKAYGSSGPISCGMYVVKKLKSMVRYSFYWILSLILLCRRPPSVKADIRYPRMIPSALELKEAGVHFKVKETSSGYLDITFVDGVLEMPMVPIQAATIPLFRNLVAFEQCSPEVGSYFTSYVALMDNLIDIAEDVLVLETSGIVESKLGGRDEVTKFFNSLGKGAYLNYEDHYLKDLFKEVKKYSATEINQWRAKLVHDYFGNPWSVVSVIAAIILLIVAVIQTIFSVLAYAAPPSPDSPSP